MHCIHVYTYLTLEVLLVLILLLVPYLGSIGDTVGCTVVPLLLLGLPTVLVVVVVVEVLLSITWSLDIRELSLFSLVGVPNETTGEVGEGEEFEET